MSYKEYYIQQLSAGSIADLEQLHAAVYGKKASPGFFMAKYDTAYTGAQYIGYMAYTKDEGLPIAYYGVIPCFISYGGGIILAAQSADTMTHPGHRYKGLFVELANQTYQLCRETGIRLLFGFPNQNSAPGFLNKLNWETAESMDRFEIPVNGLPLERLSYKLPGLKTLYRAYVNRVLRKHLLLDKGVAGWITNDGYGGVYRDDAYLQYKAYSKIYVVRLSSSVIWFKINNGLCIGDMVVHDSDFEQTIFGLKTLAQKLGLQQISFQSSPGTRLHHLFQKRYEAIPSFPVIFLNLGSDVRPDRIKFTFADIDIF